MILVKFWLNEISDNTQKIKVRFPFVFCLKKEVVVKALFM